MEAAMGGRSADRSRRAAASIPAARLLAGWVAIALGLGACSAQKIPQPVVPEGIQVAPDDARVDLTVPTFSHPTEITNPLFPVSKQASVLLLGQVGGQPFRTEVTLLPETRVVEWEGQRIEVAVSQYTAYLSGKITEIAIDLYAQSDDGSVWYFGEDVSDFRDGAIVVTEGTWQAGRDGPAAMIMPGHPKVGDVYRAENAPGFVFEQVTVASVADRLDGPFGPIEGGMTASELHSDGATEQKVFAPGYGEFFTGDGTDVEALALAVPTDALSEPLPSELTTLSDGALAVYDAAASGDWSGSSATAADMAAAWERYRAGEVPRLIEPLMTDSLGAFADAVDARGSPQVRQAAIEVARWAFDLQLRHRPVVEVDLDRLDLWAAQLMLDVEADDQPAFLADAFAIDYVRDRIVHALSASDRASLDTEVGAIQLAVADDDMGAGAEAAGRLRELLAGLAPAA
jgi:hypothetical protein